MKQHILRLSLALSLCLSGCSSPDSKVIVPASNDTTPTEIGAELTDEQWMELAEEYLSEIEDEAGEETDAGMEEAYEDEPEFPYAYKQFANHAGDVSYLRDHIAFPYFHAGMENRVITAADFESEHPNSYLFQMMTEREGVSTAPLENRRINSWLKDKFIEKYGNLDDIHVANLKPMPMGYLAYFKRIELEFKFIGCEQIEAGD